MADIVLTCEQCGKQTTVSEFVAPEALVCGSCGRRLKKPETAGSQRKAITLKQAAPPPAEPQPSPAAARRQWGRPRKQRRQRHKPAKTSPAFMGWLVFLLLAGVLGYIRCAVMTESHVQTVIEVAPVAVVLINLGIVIMAFKDDGVFFGVLCLFVPCYSLYYLFFLSDTFYLRSIIAALLVAFGKDASLAMTDVTMAIYASIARFIATQGESIDY